VHTCPEKSADGIDRTFEDQSRASISLRARLPQDGRIIVNMEGKPIDFRVSTVPPFPPMGRESLYLSWIRSNTSPVWTVISHAPVLTRPRVWSPSVRHHVCDRPNVSGKTTTFYSALCESRAGITLHRRRPCEDDLAPSCADPGAAKRSWPIFRASLRAFFLPRQDPEFDSGRRNRYKGNGMPSP